MSENLLDHRFDKYSSTGNDGIIEHIFKTLGIAEGLFVEFGAWDGIVGSNCRKLFEEGWDGIFIESDIKRFQKLYNNYREENQKGGNQVVCIHSHVGTTNCLFDNLVEDYVRYHFEKEIDFCSIDIDGPDVEVFETFQKYLPKVICIEGGQMFHPYHPAVPPEQSKNNLQQPLGIMIKIFESKGYKLLCSYQDTFFIKEEYYDKFNVSTDTMDLYLDGLSVLSRRIPWIQTTLNANGFSNPILEEILVRADYQSYGYKNRKIWAVEKHNEIQWIIERIRSGKR